MSRRRWASLLPVLCLVWTVLPSLTFPQPTGTKGWTIRILGIIQRVPAEPGSIVLPLKVKDHRLSFVRRLFAGEDKAPLGEIAADFMWRTPGGIEVRGTEELLMGLLREEPGQRVLALRGVYEPDLRVFHLSVVQPLEHYALDSRCPPLPAMGPADQVSVLVAKALDRPGFVCIRVTNGLSGRISHGLPEGRLQVWEEGKEEGYGQFQDFKPDAVVGRLSLWPLLWPGEGTDSYLPHSGQSAPPGRYRVCFRYEDPLWQRQSQKEVCSEEFSLP